ncbi:RNA-binding domain-containing protein [Melanomma pulvis-pyrius CBS 109.77]|uniref:RNA-binding domain-containing protein n=1 Tax=Melanomma pulvis-pyrius CBS 109.77 TaxID=1314802 RepID=A0A6A6XAE1_9PLEO|nr:RNA-binding domain-containing protein [Melanomma pulvis-pyrius CBS 109.77]
MASTTRGPPGVVVAKGNAPNRTLYCNNLPDQLSKDDLKRNLYMLFATYGIVLDIVALKTGKMRGQAHIVFRDIDSSTQAMLALQGFNFFGKEMKIAYARGKSHTIAKLDGTFKLPEVEKPAIREAEPTSAQVAVFGSAPAPAKAKPVQTQAQDDATKGVKRGREDESEGDDDDDSAMEVSDDDD